MKIAASFIALSALTLPTAAFAAQPVTGTWLTEDKKALVSISDCGKTVCGKISKILAPTPDGPPVDEYNPDPKLRKRPILGLPVLSGFTPNDGEWKGRIYSPEEGKSYRSVLIRDGSDKLKVKGCIAFFCKTQVWTRAR